MSLAPWRAGWLALLVILTVGGGMLIGVMNPPGAWYESLMKPSFTPPNWLFPVAWTAIYILVAVAGWRVFPAGPQAARVLWILQLALNFSWSRPSSARTGSVPDLRSSRHFSRWPSPSSRRHSGRAERPRSASRRTPLGSAMQHF